MSSSNSAQVRSFREEVIFEGFEDMKITLRRGFQEEKAKQFLPKKKVAIRCYLPESFFLTEV